MADPNIVRAIAATLVLLGCAGVVAAHLTVLLASGQSALSTPIGELSRGTDGGLHGLGLLAFAAANLALVVVLHSRRTAWPRRAAQLLLAVDAVLLLHLARHFASASEERLQEGGVNDPLVIIACVVGLAMGLLVPSLMKRTPRAGLWNIVCLALWIALFPLALFVDGGWIGAYERFVGGVFVLWMAGLAVLVGLLPRRRSR